MSDVALTIDRYDPADPDPWLALNLDQTLPIRPVAKAALLRDTGSKSREFLMPIVRPFARMTIILAQLVHTISPRWPHAPKLLHTLIAWGMKRFLSPDANTLILRHFSLGSQILAFIAANATPGFRPDLKPMRPRRIDDVKDLLFLYHDRNIYNFIIQLNQELSRRGDCVRRIDNIDFSAIEENIELEPLPNSRLNVVDVATAIELYTPAYAMFLTDRDFWRATNSLQLDETIGLYAARITGEEKHLALINNRHPMVPLSTLAAGSRLMLHGLASEVLHGLLLELKHKAAGAKCAKAAPLTGR